MIPRLQAADAHFAAAMAAIHQAAFAGGDAWSQQDIETLLGAAGMSGLIDPRGGMVLIRQAADTADLVTLAVDPARRRGGIATRLLTAALADAARAGATQMLLEVAETNLAARALYAACGFVQAGRRRRYYPDGTDALVLRRSCG